MIDFFGHIGYLTIFIGVVLLSRHHPWGWIFRLVGEVIWFGVGIALGLSSVWMWGIVFICMDIYGWYKWRQENWWRSLL